MDIPHSVYSLLYDNLNFFHMLVIVNKCCHKPGCTRIFSEFLLSIIPLSTYPAVELLDHVVILSVIFGGTTLLFSIATAPFSMEYFILSF